MYNKNYKPRLGTRFAKFKESPIAHMSICPGDKLCPRCGRRICQNCTTHDKKGTHPHSPGHEGECLICSEMYDEAEIVLYPDANKVKEAQDKLAELKKLEKKKPRRMIQI